ncbi:hypothetical protein NQ314_007458 [Rhamnusium bicolor]|uniref:Signal recognition particle 14 kDa protein n=1 Tax=Rhamnusium bicolor TaxID=1586634 RepID=A0AAV8YNJ0_9CUCU|nr:hypothetical protein NQ314_007458 [Rhamnusium bicolor]
MVLLENDSVSVLDEFKLKSFVLPHDGRDRPTPRVGKPPLPESQEHMCLVRAKFRSQKIATVIHQRDVNKFQVAYSSLLKGNLDGLKKLKKPKTKTKAE